MVEIDLPLLHTKLQRPRQPRRLVARPHLWARLDRGLDKPLILVAAGAGFGKTTLVSSWLEELAGRAAAAAPLESAWLTLDENDGDLVLFLRYFVRAVRSVQPGACSKTDTLLYALRQPRQELLFATISNELAQLSSDLVLVLDDYSALHSHAVDEFMAALLRNWPQPLHLVLITRFDPRLPLPALRAKGAIVYLADEVFSNLPPVIQDFLLQTSILDRFCAALCSAILEARIDGGDAAWSAGACIEWLLRANLFTVALDGRSEWYRYHHLFRDMLRRRAGTELAEEKLRGLHRRAALWFADQHLFDEALRQALAAGDPDLTVQIAEEGLPDVHNREDWLTLERWLSLLPPTLIETRPWLLVMKAWILQFTWQLGAQLRVLDQIETLLEQPELERSPSSAQPGSSRARLEAHVALLRGQHAFFRNKPALALELLARVSPSMHTSWASIHGGIMLYTGVSMQAVGQGEAAERLLVDSFEQYDNKADPYGLRLLMSLCFNYFAQGKLEQVRQTATTMQRLGTHQPTTTMQSWAEYFLGLAHYEWNQPAAAEVHFAAVAERRYIAVLAVVRDALHQLAVLQQQRGDSAGAWGTLDQLSEIELEQNGREDEGTRGLRARLLLMQGDIDSAGRWADAFVAPVPDQPLLWLSNPHLIKARILLARQHETDFAAAQQILEALQVRADQTYNTRFSIEILALLAMSYAAQGREAAAQAALEGACELARPGGFVRLFVELGPAMRALLAGLARQNTGTRRLLAAFGDGPEGAPQDGPASSAAAVRGNHAAPGPPGMASGTPSGTPTDGPLLVEPLTQREREVLALLSEPLSPKEIARKLDISHGTLKRHVANVYGKLGVTTRWDAVAQAKALRLLPTG